MRKALILLFFAVFLYGKTPQYIFQVWKPYKFSANEYYEYELNSVSKQSKPRTGHYTIRIEKVKNGYRVSLKGKYMFSQGSFSGVVPSLDSVVPFIMKKTLYSSTFTLFSRFVVNEMFKPGSITEKLKWQNGSSVKFSNGGLREVKGDCEFGGYKGKWIITYRNNTEIDRACISPDVPMPIYVKAYNPINPQKTYAEVKLKRYKKE